MDGILHRVDGDTSVVLVGNKCDELNPVKANELKAKMGAFANERMLEYVQCSAKTGENVQS